MKNLYDCFFACIIIQSKIHLFKMDSVLIFLFITFFMFPFTLIKQENSLIIPQFFFILDLFNSITGSFIINMDFTLKNTI